MVREEAGDTECSTLCFLTSSIQETSPGSSMPHFRLWKKTMPCAIQVTTWPMWRPLLLSTHLSPPFPPQPQIRKDTGAGSAPRHGDKCHRTASSRAVGFGVSTMTLTMRRRHQEPSSPLSTYKVCTALGAELNHSTCSIRMTVPGCRLLLFTSPAHVLVPMHAQEPLKNLWVSPPWLGEAQE